MGEQEETYNISALVEAFDSFPTADEMLPALVQLGQDMDEAWKAMFPWAIVNCDDDRLALILGKRKRGLFARLWEWLIK